MEGGLVGGPEEFVLVQSQVELGPRFSGACEKPCEGVCGIEKAREKPSRRRKAEKVYIAGQCEGQRLAISGEFVVLRLLYI